MKIIIAGAGEVGSHLAKMLSNEANDLTIIDSDQGRLDALSRTRMSLLSPAILLPSVSSRRPEWKTRIFSSRSNPSTSQDVNIVSAMLAKKLGSKSHCPREL